MRPSFISSFSRGILFAAGLIAAYAAAVAALSSIDLGERTALERLIGTRLPTGGNGYTLQRFRELEGHPQVEVLFAGSSHAFMSLDPRVFAAQGLSSFNMGSMGQSPLNTYYLFRSHHERLHPRAVVIEAYYRTLQGEDGLESFYDLLYNSPVTWNTVKMAFATRSPTAVTALLGEIAARRRKPLAKYVQSQVPNMRYVRGGFCETDSRTAIAEGGEPAMTELSERQIDYLKKTVRLARVGGSKVFVVVQPFSNQRKAASREYRAISDRIRGAVEIEGASFTDFNGKLALDPEKDFCDGMHLSASGAKKFSAAVAELVKKRL